ncbi:hypothetical protein [Pedobacter endophyticus]|uniref:Uncharacterized protein n=1 Tax=Pedobacter endophyticus TaxID=2789740 RepID=A0A7S9L2T1_9SPHI|nr:hypothetical protein [Pedobacter endophyticus]QPH41444.1 hypothetical protein IZT61_09375 [Pedobacter endophyticus]
MKRLLQIIPLLLIFFNGNTLAQNPIQSFWSGNQNTYLLDQAAPVSASSFAYSLRKLRRGYTGYCLRVRRNILLDNTEADIAFDVNGVVSAKSIVTITATIPLTSGLNVGDKMTLAAFKGSQQLLATIWYDQGLNGYHATQTNVLVQPELLLNTAGTGNTKPSLSFNGSQYLIVGQPLQNLMTNGINGTFLLAAKVGSNTTIQYSFGFVNGTTWRWLLHLNYNNGNVYFDAAEPCCTVSDRTFANSTSLNTWKQYSFIRGTSSKLARRSNVTVIDDSTAPSTARTGGDFWIGSASGIPLLNSAFIGNLSEAVMFPRDFTAAQVVPLEFSQIQFWGL